MIEHRIIYSVHDIHKKIVRPIDSILAEVANTARGYFAGEFGHGYIKSIHLQNGKGSFITSSV